ncbi:MULTISPECIES: hypothetical protein [Staphylococcaceae]|jgi:hypothetical protein|uniref:Uncharacterized protein n=1 Tax=Staphylococcus shinii TaxID=2912228 RepID=A0A418IFA8_9STAP|nr:MULTISPECIES: hypothetical protein [Staphylococcaceae]HAP2019756.1 hypothetical protein [Escherichia coli]MEB8071637.1 hypothetical protein [Staphylococcus xylosus]MEB8090744.1 hypothetical protein [Staphylococcus saprophyticus]MEC5302558.1 hypothetical protein [Staphylococcus shinii]QMU10988.1 hypothetical protein H3V22_01835 [Mammaliicoccus lentus]
MTVNHASMLSVDYFISYLNLVMLSREVNLKEATLYMENEFFKGNIHQYGDTTETNFNQAIQLLEKKGF